MPVQKVEHNAMCTDIMHDKVLYLLSIDSVHPSICPRSLSFIVLSPLSALVSALAPIKAYAAV